MVSLPTSLGLSVAIKAVLANPAEGVMSEHMTRLPPKPELSWKEDGTPVADGFDDVYFSTDSGLEETRVVFLKACGLPERWSDVSGFTVGELGFGTGLNFLATVQLWLSSPKQDNAWLHFVSVEGFPLSRADAERALSRWSELSEFSSLLLSRWPVRTRGTQRVSFPEWQVTLTIMIDEAETCLPQCIAEVDAWFLDGFSPSKNPALWSELVLNEVTRLAAPGCQLGTYSAAGAIRRGLSERGWHVEKVPGFGRKRDRTEAVISKQDLKEQIDPLCLRPETEPFRGVNVIGAGIAGACVARAFAERGFPVLVKTDERPHSRRASANPLGLVMPRLDAGDTAQSRLLLHTYLYALDVYDRVGGEAVDRLDVHQKPQNEKDRLRFEKLLADPPLDEFWLAAATDDEGGLIHKGAALVHPERLVEALLNHPNISVSLSDGAVTEGVDRTAAPDELTVVCSGHHLGEMLEALAPAIIGKLGQVDWQNVSTPRAGSEAVAAGVYALSAQEKLLFGATFEKWEAGDPIAVTPEAQKHNLEGLSELAPDLMSLIDKGQLQSRASVRATTPDRLPVAGVYASKKAVEEACAPLAKGGPMLQPVGCEGHIYVVGGLGSRGFTFAPLMAEVVAAAALGEPAPLSRSELEHISPLRFMVRAIKRGQV